MDSDRRAALLSIPLLGQLVALAAANPDPAAGVPPEGAAAPQALASRSVPFEQATHTVERYGETWRYFKGATAQLSACTAWRVKLNSHAAPHPPHTHDEEEMMLVTEGAGEIVIGDEVTPIAAGSMAFCAGGRVHGIRNTTGAPLTYYYWKWRR
jgi:quercetin dioxygenase-like cupin family protein